jgi:predicted nucleic acid-binding protein
VPDVVCLDAGVWIKALVAEEGSEVAVRLVKEATARTRIVAPAFCWTEVGSVLRKKVRTGELSLAESSEAWGDFQDMLIQYLDTPAMHERAWVLADQFQQPTLHDAAYLACTELADGPSRTFWTADESLLAALGKARPAYVRPLREAS